MVSPLFRRSRHAMALLALLPGWVAAQAQAPQRPRCRRPTACAWSNWG